MPMLCLALLITQGSLWPTWATGFQVAVLAASGLVGFVFGDNYYFRCLVILGPGRAALLSSLAPLFTVLIAWPALGERPGPLAALGMALTMGGVWWVLGAREARIRTHVEGSVTVGVIAGVLASLGQAGGYVLSKVALDSGIDALSGTVIRITAACIGIWVLAGWQRAVVSTIGALRDRRATVLMLAGALSGPFLGVTLSLAALQYIEAGVAASITAIYPIPTLLISASVGGEKLTWRSFGGAVVAVVGVIVLFLR
jgi:drug/metabolite transporter (DMT)-like permease